MSKCIFIIDDDRDPKLAKSLVNSIRKFHKDIPIKVVKRTDKEEWVNDPVFYYRATPIIASELMEEYDTVYKMDADNVVMGDLSHIFSLDDYDVGTVFNINRVDPAKFGHITTSVIDAKDYYNCGFVALKSKAFVKHWLDLCFSQYFSKLQYREQDLLNIMCHFGEYKVRCFDHYDSLQDYFAWHGLIAKGEGMKMILKDKEVILPAGDDGYPPKDTVIKIFHYAGGGHEPKNHRLYFSEPVIEYIDWLISDEKVSPKTNE